EAVRRAQSDPGPVVIDEVAGQWLALALLVAAQPRPLSLGLVAGSFLLFRLFDVVKPWPIGRLERLPGGWGILADDLAAGLAAGLVHLAVLAWL
ncbi:MAG: phosphatidylglycerophosphatase A, partial [Acidobacteriota bacterium]